MDEKYIFLLFPILFLLYSFLGWIIDTTYRSIMEKRISIGDGYPFPHFLPLSPIYGFGALVAITISPTILELPILAQFFILAIILTSFEYASAVVAERFVHRKLWDYSNQPLNLHGRISFTHSLEWGLLGLVLIRFINPFILWILTVCF